MDLPRDQNLEINLNNKLKYGEVHTPYALIEKMLSLLPEYIFSDPSKRWLDTGEGRGYFSLYLFEKLNKGLNGTDERRKVVRVPMFNDELNKIL